jgi:hypothetical protein
VWPALLGWKQRLAVRLQAAGQWQRQWQQQWGRGSSTWYMGAWANCLNPISQLDTLDVIDRRQQHCASITSITAPQTEGHHTATLQKTGSLLDHSQHMTTTPPSDKRPTKLHAVSIRVTEPMPNGPPAQPLCYGSRSFTDEQCTLYVASAAHHTPEGHRLPRIHGQSVQQCATARSTFKTVRATTTEHIFVHPNSLSRRLAQLQPIMI